MAQKKKIVIEDENEKKTQGEAEAPESAIPAEGEEKAESAESPLKELEEKLAEAQAQAEDHRDRMLRMAAELENVKKRTSREMEDVRKYATENLIRQLLDVVDNLERAIASASPESQNDKGVVDGVVLTLAEITKILEKHHVKPIEAMGEPFDPAFHQAMSQEERSDHPSNTVVQEFQKGYLMHDRLLRPAMVVVSKNSQNGQSNEKSVDTQA
jgi:molecular chaperone GrpE